MHRSTLFRATVATALAGSLVACSDNNSSTTPTQTADITKVNHIVVIYLENRSFDNMYSEFAGANGSLLALQAAKQIDASGAAYAQLPQTNDSKIPTNLANAPFNIAQYVPPATPTRDLVHRFYQEQMQIDKGKMDKFAQISDAQGLSMGYYHTSQMPLAAEAAKYTLADNFFHSAFGGSFLNHIFFISAAAPAFPGAPASITAVLDASGNLVTDGAVTPDGYAVNTSYSVNQPHPSTAAASTLVPNQTIPTIGDRLSDKNVTWAWYSGGWNDALAGHPDPLFQFHHQPFIYFSNFADGKQAKTDHLKDEADFIAAANAGTLPAVSFIKPLGMNNEHAGYADIITGENHTMQLIDAVRNGPNWKDAAIIITYDENGGFWDHVAPPTVDKWGPGTRIPAIIVSPFAKKGFVDHTQYETVSILSFIEKRYGLTPLAHHDSLAANMTAAFDFSQTP
ncbi:MAG TPA: acid phosphatase [Gemmatimonadaceae bacterium]|jgi:phospholipase C